MKPYPESSIVNPESSISLPLSPTLTLILYCLAIVAASLAGGWLPMLVRLTHRRMELALSFVSGVMVGVATLLLIPHAFAARLDASPLAALPGGGEASHGIAHEILGPVMLSLLAGFLVMFLIERFFCFHHHEAPDEASDRVGETHGHDHAGCAHGHAHEHDGGKTNPNAHTHSLSWGGAAIGLTLHSLLDGVALAASVAVLHHGESDSAVLAGLGTFLVIFLHKPFDSLTLGTLMAAGRKSSGMRHFVNFAFALLTPIGAGLFMFGIRGEGPSQSLILSIALAFAAGTFLCIALSDLLPELQFHQHDRVQLSIALVLGLALAWGVAEMEARTHVHEEHATSTPASPAMTGHEGHGH